MAASLRALKETRPDFAPQSLLDIGAGPGTATWAATEAFSSLADLALLDNRITRIGRTGLYLGGVGGARVAGNILHDIRGIHGNGISIYLANRNVRVEGNCVYASDRPLTFKGAGARDTAPNGIVIRSNILIGSPGRNYGVTSWGAVTRDVTISGNILRGGKRGLRLHASDQNVTVHGNLLNGILVVGDQPPGWSVDGNREMKTLPEGIILTPERCILPGDPGPIRIGAR